MTKAFALALLALAACSDRWFVISADGKDSTICRAGKVDWNECVLRACDAGVAPVGKCSTGDYSDCVLRCLPGAP